MGTWDLVPGPGVEPALYIGSTESCSLDQKEVPTTLSKSLQAVFSVLRIHADGPRRYPQFPLEGSGEKAGLISKQNLTVNNNLIKNSILRNF